MQDYRRLTVWEEAHKLAVSIYLLTKTFPAFEKFGLISQMTRAASSIPANIVEGAGRNSQKELRTFLFNSLGSSKELEYFLLLSRDLAYLAQEDFNVLSDNCNKVTRMLTNLIKNINATANGKRQTANE